MQVRARQLPVAIDVGAQWGRAAVIVFECALELGHVVPVDRTVCVEVAEARNACGFVTREATRTSAIRAAAQICLFSPVAAAVAAYTAVRIAIGGRFGAVARAISAGASAVDCA